MGGFFALLGLVSSGGEVDLRSCTGRWGMLMR